MAQFGRTASVTIGNPGDLGILVEDLRIVFDCKKTMSSTDPNTCDIRIYNMNETRRNRINNIDDIVVLEAGYSESVGNEVIFTGDVVAVNDLIDPPEIMTNIKVGDGQKFILRDKQSVSFGGGATVRQILNEVTKNAKDIIGNNLDLIDFQDSSFKYGFSELSSTKKILDDLTDIAGISWSVQDNEIKFDKDELLDFEIAVVLNSDTGLIGSPERINLDSSKNSSKKINGWKVVSFLQPKALPGGTVLLSSRDVGIDKQFKIINVSHVGDTFESDFLTTMELKQI
jgi:hypothetical protein